MSRETQPAMAYPTADQYDRWKARAEELDMSVSAFMQAMVEAGLKKFDTHVNPDEPVDELREQRNDLKAELDHARTRIQRLEDRIHHGEQATIENYVQTHPGATYPEIVQHVVDTAPQRVNDHLEVMEGEALKPVDGGYHPIEHHEEEA